jgi:hypothetical protein
MVSLRSRRIAKRVCGVFGAGLILGACVDLFHPTDFATLCQVSPDAAACESTNMSDAQIVMPVRDGSQDVEASVDSGPDTPCTDDVNLARIRATRACELEVSCGGAVEPRLDCVALALRVYDCKVAPGLVPSAYWNCMRDAKTCAAYDKCVYPLGVPTCSAAGTLCAPNATIAHCSAAGVKARATSCAAQGQDCVNREGIATCAGGAGNACTGPVRCEGDRLVACSGTFDEGRDCSVLGETCSPIAGPGCVPKVGGVCAADSIQCVSGRVESCLGGIKSAFDCSRLGLACDTNYLPNVFQACRRPDPCTSSCIGGELKSCARGNAFTVKCSDLGLGACTQVAGASRPSCAPSP